MMRKFSALLLAGLVACGSIATYNPTVYPYKIDTEKLAATELRRVIIAQVNLGGPSRNYLIEAEPRIDKQVEQYLEEHGMTVLPQILFEQRWKTAIRVYGNPYDPTTGKVNQKTFAFILTSVSDELRAAEQLDAIVFTDILQQEVAFSGGLKHLARWHGVARKPTLQGPGDGVSGEFNWNRPAQAASLRISVYTMDLQRLFLGIGGLDTTEAIDTRSSSGRFVRRRSILENRGHIREGIELALHPLIPMQKYPGDR